ncbi:MAG: hypothetical protein WDK96_02395 [Candidatus Paceibacterota bacterium]|jgi:hypothetical protein
MKKPDFKPLDLGKFKKELTKKIEDKTEKKESRYDSLMKVIEIQGIDDKLFLTTGSIPYFLDDIDSIKLSEKHNDTDTDGDEWKNKVNLENKDWQKQIDEMKEKNFEKPFQINFSYGDEAYLEKSGIIDSHGYGNKVFYLPKKYESQIKTYNEYIEGKIKKKAEDEFSELTKNINFN